MTTNSTDDRASAGKYVAHLKLEASKRRLTRIAHAIRLDLIDLIGFGFRILGLLVLGPKLLPAP